MMKVNSKADAADVTPVKSSDTNEAKPTDPQHISKEDRDTFIARFKELDTNKSGVLEEKEYNKAAVSKEISFDEARQLVTKDKYLTQSDFVVARGQYAHAKPEGPTQAPKSAQTPAKAQTQTQTPAPAQTDTKPQTKLQGGATDTVSALMKGQPQELAQWADNIAAASRASGVPPQVIAGQIWAESRGDETLVTINPDGTKDYGLMQIGQERWQRDVVPKLTPDQRAAITAATGLKPEELQMPNPLHNVVGGAFHILNWKNGSYGQPATDWGGAFNGYVNGRIHDPRGISSSHYGDLVRGYAQMITEGLPLQGQDHQHPRLFD